MTEAKSHCPYCTKEIAADDIYCPECAVAFGEETLLVTKDLVKEMLESSTDIQRKHDRVPKKFKITYSSPKAFERAYLEDIGKGGVFIKTSKVLPAKQTVNLKILLPDEEELEVLGEVAWTRKEEVATPKGKRPAGMGIRFLKLSPEAIKKIDNVLKRSKT